MAKFCQDLAMFLPDELLFRALVVSDQPSREHWVIFNVFYVFYNFVVVLGHLNHRIFAAKRMAEIRENIAFVEGAGKYFSKKSY